jgi:hypothetical protein
MSNIGRLRAALPLAGHVPVKTALTVLLVDRSTSMDRFEVVRDKVVSSLVHEAASSIPPAACVSFDFVRVFDIVHDALFAIAAEVEAFEMRGGSVTVKVILLTDGEDAGSSTEAQADVPDLSRKARDQGWDLRIYTFSTRPRKLAIELGFPTDAPNLVCLRQSRLDLQRLRPHGPCLVPSSDVDDEGGSS